jgi:hypothetical protein
MGRDSRYPQAVDVDNLAYWRLQVYLKVHPVYLFVCSKRSLIFPGAAFVEEKIQEPGSAGEHTRACGPEDREMDCRRTRHECPGDQESWQIAAVIDVQVGKQHGIHPIEIDRKLSDAQEGPRPDVDQDSWSAVYLDNVA